MKHARKAIWEEGKVNGSRTHLDSHQRTTPRHKQLSANYAPICLFHDSRVVYHAPPLHPVRARSRHSLVVARTTPLFSTVKICDLAGIEVTMITEEGKERRRDERPHTLCNSAVERSPAIATHPT